MDPRFLGIGDLDGTPSVAVEARQGVHPDDVALCLELDRFPFAMVAAPEDSLMVLCRSAAPPPGPVEDTT